MELGGTCIIARPVFFLLMKNLYYRRKHLIHGPGAADVLPAVRVSDGHRAIVARQKQIVQRSRVACINTVQMLLRRTFSGCCRLVVVLGMLIQQYRLRPDKCLLLFSPASLKIRKMQCMPMQAPALHETS